MYGSWDTYGLWLKNPKLLAGERNLLLLVNWTARFRIILLFYFMLFMFNPVANWRRVKTTQRMPRGISGGENLVHPESMNTLREPCNCVFTPSHGPNAGCRYTAADLYTSGPFEVARLGRGLPERYDPTHDMITTEHYYTYTCHYLCTYKMHKLLRE